MNQLEFSYEDYLHNLTKSCEKIENFNTTVLDDNCLDSAPSSFSAKFMLDDQEVENASIDTNLNLSNTLSNTISSTISSSSSFSNVSNQYLDSVYNEVYSQEGKLDLTGQLISAKSASSANKNSNNSEMNSAKTKVPIKKRKVGVNHKFVNNPKHLKKCKQSAQETTQFMSTPFQVKLLKNSDLNTTKNESDKLLKSYSSSPSSKGMGCGKPGYITCAICNTTKYYSHVQRRFGQFSCEPCSKYMKKFLKDPKVYYCLANGECQIGKPSGEQEPRGVSVNRCKACWLKICLDKFVLEDETREVIDSHYKPRFQNLESSMTENRSVDDSNILPPLPILNTRKRKSNDDTLIEKYTNQHSKDEERKSSETKTKRKHTDAKSDKRERKRKLIYSPPSTPKPRSKKQQQRLKDQSKSDDDQSNESMIKSNDKRTKSEHSSSDFFLDELNNSSEIDSPERSNQCSLCNHQSIETNCSLSSDQLSSNESKYCSQCLNAKNMSLTSAEETKSINQFNLDEFSKFSSEDCIVDNCSELSYEFANKQDDHYLKESFYDYTPAKTTEEELGLKYIKNYEKQSSTKKESKFTKARTKKTKKRKELLTNNNLMRKQLMKKNSFSYIFDSDSKLIYEILNANSPFL